MASIFDEVLEEKGEEVRARRKVYQAHFLAKLKTDPQREAEYRRKHCENSLAYYWKNRERILAQRRAERQADPEGHRAYDRAYCEQHREEIRARARARRRRARLEAQTNGAAL